ncbi:hypothetical protein FM120_31460 [Sphingobacterium faecium PCAi_F2.5]|nr:hypothetical protein FM120_31460 [Sphingobacterium faecium PCAi_F2.5]
MEDILTINQKIKISNRIWENIEELCLHNISKREALERILKIIEENIEKKL